MSHRHLIFSWASLQSGLQFGGITDDGGYLCVTNASTAFFYMGNSPDDGDGEFCFLNPDAPLEINYSDADRKSDGSYRQLSP